MDPLPSVEDDVQWMIIMRFEYMNMMKVLFCVMLTASFSLAANMVTYTATSNVSQKDADKKALEGVAMQIGAKVDSKMETRLSEKADGSIEKTTDSKKSVSTNVLVKGAKIVPGPKSNGLFQSTVTVDLDQLASKILLDLDQVKVQMKSKDSLWTCWIVTTARWKRT